MEAQRIMKLDPSTIGKIAAGEVVEKPAMVVKELVENAIDAGATEILVDVKRGGKSSIRVTDNGSGINPEDVTLLFERHATSKIRRIEDLYKAHSLGFRGEALSSICAVSNIELITMRSNDTMGLKVNAAGGKILKQSAVGTVVGTSIWVKDLFFNTPARLKFLKTDQVEGRFITELMSYLALSHPEIAFRYTLDDRILFHTPGKNKLSDAIFSIYESDMLRNLFEMNEVLEDVQLKGYASKFQYSKGTKSHQIVFINGRYVKSDLIKEIVQMAYKPYMMQNRFPVCFLFFEVPPESIDVNIHPAKTEIKFHEEGKIKQILYTALKKAFNLYDHVPEVSFQPIKVAEKADSSDAPMVEQRKAPLDKSFEGYKPKVAPMLPPMAFPKVNFEVLQEMMHLTAEVPVMAKPLEEMSVYEGLHYIGVFDGTYLIFEKDGQLVMIDQHAAHEKVLYEQLVERFERDEVTSQILLLPEMVELDRITAHTVGDLKGFFHKMGYAYDAFGENSIVIREIPSVLNIGSALALFKAVLEGIDNPLEAKWDEKMASRACKAAIKAHDRLDGIEVDELIRSLIALKSPYTCPHGRPIVVRFSKHEIERKFKRIV